MPLTPSHTRYSSLIHESFEGSSRYSRITKLPKVPSGMKAIIFLITDPMIDPEI